MKSKAAELLEPNTSINHTCPSCFEKSVSIFYEAKDIPVHSVLLLETMEQALSYPKGEIALGLCQSCGFVSNFAFDPKLHEYSSKYESSQAFSSTYNNFSKRLAVHLIERYDLHNKNIIEIGCGQGEFISLLAQLGGNHGIGFDPAFDGSRTYNIPDIQNHNTTISGNHPASLNVVHSEDCSGCVSFVRDFYGEKYGEGAPDFICCKMTLEHIQNTSDFILNVRNSLGERGEAVVFFQVPELTRILDELAFWDIYYEHCSYFSAGSLARLFRRCGFEVIDVWTDYDDQYLMVEAVANTGEYADTLAIEDDFEELKNKVAFFSQYYPRKLDVWKQRLNEIRKKNHKAVIWGSSSKGVSFLTTLKISYRELEYVVDINPYRQGSYIAGTGQKIVSPKFLSNYRPDVVIVMNPIYLIKIINKLGSMKLNPQ